MRRPLPGWIVLILIFVLNYCCFGCLKEERDALLQIKAWINPPNIDGYALSSWVDNEEDADCCKWDLVECNTTTKRVIKLSLGNTGEWKQLGDLYLNTSLFQNLKELRSLDLSGNHLVCCSQGTGALSKELRNLEDLDLSWNNFNDSIASFLRGASSLRSLNIAGNSLSGSVHINGEVLNTFPPMLSLKQAFCCYNALSLSRFSLSFFPGKNLDLSFNSGLKKFISPREFYNLTNLEELFLDGTYIPRSVLLNIGALSSLKILSLNQCKLNGTLPEELYLSDNGLVGKLPSCMRNLSSLLVMDLSSNQFTGNVAFTPLIDLISLQCLSFSSNHFRVPSSFASFFNHSNIKFISCDHNELITEPNLQTSSAPVFQLNFFSMSNCTPKTGKTEYPYFLYFQHDLRVLDLSDNNFGGQFPSWLVQNNTRLKQLYLKNTALVGPLQLKNNAIFSNLSTIDISSNYMHSETLKTICSIFPNLQNLMISDNGLTGGIPQCFENMSYLGRLDMSNNKLSSALFELMPSFGSSLWFLKLSNNNFKGRMSATFLNQTSFEYLFIDNNNFYGHIPNSLSPKIFQSVLDISNNHFSGMLPRWLGNLSSIQAIDFSKNQLEGSIPEEICNLNQLEFLDLSENNLSGYIPSCSNLPRISHVHLYQNQLSGPLRYAFYNSSNLFTLDLGDNKLTGPIPKWINSLSELSVLLLKGNNLDGDLPVELCLLKQLSILDLSQNMFSGRLPPCLSNINSTDIWIKSQPSAQTFLADDEDDSLKGARLNKMIMWPEVRVDEFIEFRTKTNYYSYKDSVLNLMSGVDLSCNRFTGEIPPEIGNMQGLRALNLSHNNLTGAIPTTFSNLEQIESLDLSYNGLTGGIPQQLTELYSLAVFSVADNNLSGKTPEMKGQFATFDQTSYEGNPFLCGPPLRKSCIGKSQLPSGPEDSSGADDRFMDLEAFCISFGLAYTTVMVTIAAVLCTNPYWRRLWFYFIEMSITTCYYFVVDSFLKLYQMRPVQEWVLILLFALNYCCYGCLEEERDALLQIKTWITHPNGNALSSWVDNEEDADCCKWDFVGCNNTTKRVTKLSLGQKRVWEMGALNLNTSLFLSLKELKSLDLTWNRLVYCLQGALSLELRNLEDLDLSWNNLNDSILPLLPGASSLRSLNMSYNSLTGWELDLSSNFELKNFISPREFYYLTNLEVLFLDYSNIPRSVLLNIGALSNLKILSLNHCKMSGTLPDLYISDNGLVGVLPPCMSNLTSLLVMDLSSNQLTGNIASSPLVDLISLQYLSFSSNQFLVPTSFASFYNHSDLKLISCDNNELIPELNLQTKAEYPYFLYFQYDLRLLDMSDDNLGGEFPYWLVQNNTRLERLYLKNNALVGALQLRYHFPNLSTIDISSNYMLGQSLEAICSNFPNLMNLIIADNGLTGGIPPCFENMTNLVYLDMSNNELTSALFELWPLFGSSVWFFKLSNNNFEGRMSPTFFNRTSFSYLYLDNNNFSGQIPNSLSAKTSDPILLDLSSNHFSGMLPRWLGNLFFIEAIDFSKNHFHGSFPGEICNLALLKFIDLSENNLSGSIPSCTNLPRISHVHLYHNQFSGPLTYAFCNSFNLVTLDLRENQFTGTIPNWINSLSKLSILLLKGNNFDGNLPVELCSLTQLSILDLSNNMFSGRLPSCLSNINFTAIWIRNETLSVDISVDKIEDLPMVPVDVQKLPPQGMVLIRRIMWPVISKNCIEKEQRPSGPEGSNYSREGEAFVDVGAFCISFGLSYTTVVVTIAAVLCINPYWRSLWFYFIEMFITTWYYFLVDSFHKLCQEWIVLMLLFFINWRYNCCYGCLKEERDALLQIKAWINHPNGKDLSGWVQNNAADCCKWDGVTCNATTKRVIELSLYNVRATELGTGALSLDLRNLESLNLDDTSIDRSNLLKLVGGLPSLKTLSFMYGYQTVDQVPEELYNLTNLEELFLDVTRLPTSVLLNIGALSSLKILSLNQCNLTGTLTNLYLSGNELAGVLPPCLRNLSSLLVMDLSSNQFTGNIASSPLVDLIWLQYLSFSSNQYQVPTSFASFYNHSDLKLISCDNNELIPEPKLQTAAPLFQLNYFSMSNCTPETKKAEYPYFLYFQYDLILLDLSDNNFGGPFPSWLVENNTGLKRLYLKNNALEGPLELHYPVSNLSTFDISSNYMHGQTLKAICSYFPNLVNLMIPDNGLTGGIPPCFENMTSLAYLDLSNNDLSSALFELWPLFGSSVWFLKLSNNNFEGRMSPTFFNQSSILYLYLDNNNFSGPIPNSVTTKTSLPRLLDLSSNQFSGMLPRWLGNLSYIQAIDFSKNHFDGSIPGEICNLPWLQFLDLSENNLSGSIPSCTNMPNIYHVHLYQNQFSGPLTYAFYNCSYLVTLDLRENQLTGTIPNWINSLSSLSILLLKGNNFDGDLPVELCLLTQLSILDLSHNMFSGGLPSCLSNINSTAIWFKNQPLSGRASMDKVETPSLSIGGQELPVQAYNLIERIMFPVISVE
ncbi:hypothetical protein Tsubulata_047724, partial [Turnera subulata]